MNKLIAISLVIAAILLAVVPKPLVIPKVEAHPITLKTTKVPEAKTAVKSDSVDISNAGVVKHVGVCGELLFQAGVTDTQNASELIRRESQCDPYAINKSSGACGIAQELPCGKSGCSLGDGLCQVKWMASYVSSRYGSWAAAVQFHNANNWY